MRGFKIAWWRCRRPRRRRSRRDVLVSHALRHSRRVLIHSPRSQLQHLKHPSPSLPFPHPLLVPSFLHPPDSTVASPPLFPLLPLDLLPLQPSHSPPPFLPPSSPRSTLAFPNHHLPPRRSRPLHPPKPRYRPRDGFGSHLWERPHAISEAGDDGTAGSEGRGAIEEGGSEDGSGCGGGG